MPTVLISNAPAFVEITSEEWELIVKQRAEAAKRAKRDAYIAELNALIDRMKADGFTLGNKHTNVWKLNKAQAWGDAAGAWIEIL